MLANTAAVLCHKLIDFLGRLRALVAPNASFVLCLDLTDYSDPTELRPIGSTIVDTHLRNELTLASHIFHAPIFAKLLSESSTGFATGKFEIRYTVAPPASCSLVEGDTMEDEPLSPWILEPTTEECNYCGFTPVFHSLLPRNTPYAEI